MQEKIRPGYKQTEVGVVPEDWVCAPLNSLGEILTGGTPPTGIRDLWGSGYPWVTPSDIKGYRDIFETERSITAAGIGRLRALPQNTVLVTCIASIGKNAILRRAGSCNQQINAVVPRSSCSPEFIYYLMEHSVDRLKANAGITATAIISKKTFGSLLFAVPDFLEQSAIAEALSDADARIAALEALIAKKHDLKQAAMQQLLTGKTRLPGFSGDWEVKRLGELGSTYGGLTGKSKVDFGHGSAKYIPFMNIMANVVVDPNSLERVDVRPGETQNQARAGDLFFNGSSETPEEVGMCALLAENVEDLYLNSFCFGFRLKSDAAANGLFLAGYFRSQQGRDLLASLAQGATRYNLSKRALLKVEFACPPLDEQVAIAEVLSDMDAELAALDAEAKKARTIKQGMMQNLLTGKVRLV
ncbi:restriction endonuclease subunit S [Paracoccus sp. 08]|uniref:restriction endonuclease subunit S n=1 Tax=Paracoccus sp. 08 TaxID=2606624 RepID=UPI0020952347|nr:restriction endonuclease subunit S [Paracoccus sp. 08]